MSDVKPCRCCSVITGFIRKALCGGSRRSSSESYYRELGDQDTLKIDGSLTSEEFEIRNTSYMEISPPRKGPGRCKTRIATDIRDGILRRNLSNPELNVIESASFHGVLARPTTRKFKEQPATTGEGLGPAGIVSSAREKTKPGTRGSSAASASRPQKKLELQAEETVKVSQKKANEQGLEVSGPERPQSSETARRPLGTKVKPRRRDSSDEETGGDEKRTKIKKSLTPPQQASISQPSTSGVIKATRSKHSSRRSSVESTSCPPSENSSNSTQNSSDEGDEQPAKYGALDNLTKQSRTDHLNSDSTSYAALESVPMDAAPMPSPPSPPADAAQSYAATLASPPVTRPGSPQTGPTTDANTATGAVPALTNTAKVLKGYPPVIAESLPDWIPLLAVLKCQLGHAPNAKPVGSGFRFTCKSSEEFRAVQRVLTEAAEKDKRVSWHCYAVAEDLPTKVAIKGLPFNTNPAEIMTELKAKGYPIKYVKEIQPRRGAKGGPTYYALMDRLQNEEKSKLYGMVELLNVPNITIEGWAPKGGVVPQCHRCQMFGHASGGCHRPMRCVKCAGEHAAKDCNRDPTQPLKCANCKGKHVACSRKCPHYLREARKRGVRVQGPYPREARQGSQQRAQMQNQLPQQQPQQRPQEIRQQHQQQQPQQGPTIVPARYACDPPTHGWGNSPRLPQLDMWPMLPQTATLAPVANPPTERGAPLPQRKKRRRYRKRSKSSKPAPSAASTPLPTRPTAPIQRPTATSRPSPAGMQRPPASGFTPIQPEARNPPSTDDRIYPIPKKATKAPEPQFLRERPTPVEDLRSREEAIQPPPQCWDRRPDPRAQQQSVPQHPMYGGYFPPPPMSTFTPASSGGNPLTLIIGILTDLLVALAAGANLQEAARRGLHHLSRFQYGYRT